MQQNVREAVSTFIHVVDFPLKNNNPQILFVTNYRGTEFTNSFIIITADRRQIRLDVFKLVGVLKRAKRVR